MPASARVHELIDSLPKVELHVHLEGTLEPEMMMELADRNGVEVPYDTADQARAAYRFHDLQSFLDVYYLGTRTLLAPIDFEEVAYAYVARVAAEGVKHVEPFFDPQAHTSRGIDLEAVIIGYLAGLERAQTDYGVTWRLIISFLRDVPEDDAMRVLEASEPWLDRIVGVGLDSAEVGYPPELFVRTYQRAAELGLRRTAHAGEEGTADDVRRTVELLDCERIDHGDHAIDDPEVVAMLVERGITVTVCPTSNDALKVFPLAHSPLKRLLDAGVRVTVNSDDPAYFGGYITHAMHATADALDLDEADIVCLARNAIEGSWADDERKHELMAELAHVAGDA